MAITIRRPSALPPAAAKPSARSSPRPATRPVAEPRIILPGSARELSPSEALIHYADAFDFIHSQPDDSVDLLLTDPPYWGIVDEDWDHGWKTVIDYVDWIVRLFLLALPKLTPTGSLLFCNGISTQGENKDGPFEHPLGLISTRLQQGGYTYRNWLTWKKRRAYGKEFDYQFCREEILWVSRSRDRKEVIFNKPYTSIVRGYAGYDDRYPAKSEYIRVSNVMVDLYEGSDPLNYGSAIIEDITEEMRPKRRCQKPAKLAERLINTHSNSGQRVVDPFAGWGTFVIEGQRLGRDAIGCEGIQKDALAADERARAVARARIGP